MVLVARGLLVVVSVVRIWIAKQATHMQAQLLALFAAFLVWYIQGETQKASNG